MKDEKGTVYIIFTHLIIFSHLYRHRRWVPRFGLAVFQSLNFAFYADIRKFERSRWLPLLIFNIKS
jgi:hypothetical protein